MKLEETIARYSGLSLYFFLLTLNIKFSFLHLTSFLLLSGFFYVAFLFFLIAISYVSHFASILNESSLIDFRPFVQSIMTKLYFILILPWICYSILLCVIWKNDLHSFVFPSSFHSGIHSNTYSMWNALKWRKMDNEMQTHQDRICQQDIKCERQKMHFL